MEIKRGETSSVTRATTVGEINGGVLVAYFLAPHHPIYVLVPTSSSPQIIPSSLQICVVLPPRFIPTFHKEEARNAFFHNMII